MDQAALDRHKTFTVLLYMMHKYKNINIIIFFVWSVCNKTAIT